MWFCYVDSLEDGFWWCGSALFADETCLQMDGYTVPATKRRRVFCFFFFFIHLVGGLRARVAACVLPRRLVLRTNCTKTYTVCLFSTWWLWNHLKAITIIRKLLLERQLRGKNNNNKNCLLYSIIIILLLHIK